MSKKKLASLIIIAVLIVAACVGGVIAYMFRDTGYKDYDFSYPVVECTLYEQTNEPLTQKESITVKSDSNVDVYVRVRLVTYWVQYDGAGNPQVVGRPSGDINFTLNDSWIAGSNNTYYYRSPVAPSGVTEDLLGESTTMPLVIEDEVYYQVIDVFAEVIQAEPADAAEESWRVTIDESGNITAAE